MLTVICSTKWAKPSCWPTSRPGSGKTGSRSWPCRTALRRWRCTDIRCRSSSCFLMRRRWPICSALRPHPIRWKNVWPRRPAFRTECRKSTRRAGCLSFTPTSSGRRLRSIMPAIRFLRTRPISTARFIAYSSERFSKSSPFPFSRAFPPYATTGPRRGVTVTAQVLSASCRRPRLLGPN